MISLIKIGETENIPIHHYRCDTELEMNQMNLSSVPAGSDCYVIDAGTFYVLNSQKLWKQQVLVSFSSTDIDIINGGDSDG